MTEAVRDNTAEHRFEISGEGEVAYLSYELEGDRLALLHTWVPVSLRHRGVGGRLVEAAVESAISGDLSIVPVCSFVRAWLRENPTVASRLRLEPPATP